MESPHWVELAACAGKPTELFFPERGDTFAVLEALAVCNTCPVKSSCLRENMYENVGIFGGTTARKRKTIRVRNQDLTRVCTQCSRQFIRSGNVTVCSDECKRRRRSAQKARSKMQSVK